MPPLSYLWLFPTGLAIGLLGTLIGAGGGFLIVPLLLFAYPRESPAVVTSISLAVIGLNALSGSAAYAVQRRIHYRSGLVFALASMPGAAIGAWLALALPRRLFDRAFGVALIAVGAYLFWARLRAPASRGAHAEVTAAEFRPGPVALRRGALLSLAVGLLSSLLGIGGGVVHVPALVGLLGYPVHVATATSHFILAISAAVGTGVHLCTGAFHHGVRRTVILGLGVMVGAPLGARLSRHVRDAWILRTLAVALVLVGVRLVFSSSPG